MDSTLIAVLAAAVGAIITALITTYGAHRKTSADATEVLTSAALELVEPLQKRLTILETERQAQSAARRTAQAELRTALAKLDRLETLIVLLLDTVNGAIPQKLRHQIEQTINPQERPTQ